MHEDLHQNLGIRAAKIAMEEWWYFGCQFVDGEDSSLPIKCTTASHGTLGRGNLPGYQERVWSYFRHGVFGTDLDYGIFGEKSEEDEAWLQYKSWAWSGAFISYCFRHAGAGDYFPYSPAHHKYMMAGVQNRLNNFAGPKTYGIDERPPQIGDLVWKGRLETRNWTIDNLRDQVKTGGQSFRSHCDLVVNIDRSRGEVLVIGGNVKNCVLRLKVGLDGSGLIKSSIYTALLSLNLQGA